MRRWPALTVRYHDVVADAEARAEVGRLAKRYQVRVASFPCIHVADRLVVGYQSDEITGRHIENIFRHTLEQGATANRDAASRDGRFRKAESAQIAQFQGIGSALASILVASAPSDARAIQMEPQVEDNLPVDEIPLPDDFDFIDEIPPIDGSTVPGGESSVISDPPAGEEVDAIELTAFGRLRVSEIGLPAFTFLIGIVDGFNPCAMWVLIFLLSVLVNIKERKKIIVVAGTFVVVSGLAYFAFMAAWFSVFQLVGLLRPVQVGLGLMAIVVGLVNVKDFFAFHKGVSFSIPDAAKPGIYRRVREIVSAKQLTVALMGAVTLAVVVNIVELLCTAGLPALYTEVLTLQNLPTWANYSYLALYIFAYMLDDAIMVTVVVATLSHRRLQESEGRWLKLLSGSVILLLGCVMLLRPEWLA